MGGKQTFVLFGKRCSEDLVRKRTLRPWYAVTLVIWAIFLLPGMAMGILMSGGQFTYVGQPFAERIQIAVLFLLFASPLLLFPVGSKTQS